jgi:hypothetical protein
MHENARAMRTLNWVFLLMFLLGAAVQINDPDPFWWIAIYLLGAVCCLAYGTRRLDWRFSAVVAGLALLWSLTLLPTVIMAPPPLSQIVTDVGMYGPGVEEARELGGLWIIAGWLFALSVSVRRRSLRESPRGAAPM